MLTVSKWRQAGVGRFRSYKGPYSSISLTIAKPCFHREAHLIVFVGRLGVEGFLRPFDGLEPNQLVFPVLEKPLFLSCVRKEVSVLWEVEPGAVGLIVIPYLGFDLG